MTAETQETRQLSLRLPTSVIERLDAHVARMAERARGVTITRADAIRSLLLDALADAEGATPRQASS